MRRAVPLGFAVLCLAAAPRVVGAASWGRVTFSTEYQAEWTEQQGDDRTSDQDSYSYLGVEVERTGVAGLTASALVWYGADLDGTSERSPYKDSLDSFDGQDDFRVYRAALSYALPSGWLTAVAGRQDVWSAEIATLDGGLLRLTPCRWGTLEVFGGKRVSHDRNPDPDPIYGGNLDLRPLPGTTLQFRDLYYIRNSLELGVVQDLGRWGSGRAAYRMLDDDPQETRLSLHLVPWAAAEAHLRYLRTFADADEEFVYDYTSAEDDTVPALYLEALAPYADYSAAFRQGFLDVFGLGGRLRYHHVIDAADEDLWNADFREGAVLFDLSDWPWKGLRLDAEYLRWAEDYDRDDLVDDDLWGYVVRLEQAIGRHSLGAGLHRQAYDSYGGRRDTEGWEIWGRARLTEYARLDLRYDREQDDLYELEGFHDLHRFTARLELWF